MKKLVAASRIVQANPREKSKSLFLVLCFLGFILSASAEVVRDTSFGDGADTYVANDSQQGSTTTHGGEAYVQIRQVAATRTKTAYIRFDISQAIGDFTGSYLTFDQIYAKTSGKSVSVYGLTDESVDLWDEATTSYSNAPAMLAAGQGDYDLDETKVTLLGTFTTSATVPATITTNPEDLDLSSFLASDTNGVVTLILIGGNDEAQFATKENTTVGINFPTLTMPNAVTGGAINPQPATGLEVDSGPLTQLQWSLTDGIGKCDVYFGTEPNLLTMTKLSYTPAVTSVTLTSFPGVTLPLADDTYYWRVDSYIGTPLPTEPNLPGGFWDFTASSKPILTDDTYPAYDSKFPGESAGFSVAFSGSALQYKWYRSTDTIPSGDDVEVGSGSAALALSGLTVEDNGYYYCTASNSGGSTNSTPAALKIKRQLAWYQFENNLNDSIGTNHGTLVGPAGGLQYPTPAFPGTPGAIAGQSYAADPNGGVYIALPQATAYPRAGFGNGLDQGTIACWVKCNPGEGGYILGQYTGVSGETGNYYVTGIRFNVSGGNVQMHLRDDDGDQLSLDPGEFVGSSAVGDGQWHYVVLTIDQGTVKLYVDVTNVASETAALDNFRQWEYDLTLMAENNRGTVGSWSFFTGALDDMIITNYPMTQEEIARAYYDVTGIHSCINSYADSYDIANEATGLVVGEAGFTKDCQINIADFAAWAAQWLESGFFPQP